MGSITRFNLLPIIEDYQTRFFIETGTWKGDALAYALRFPFKKIYSIEIVPALAQAAALRFRGDPRVQILVGHSPEILRALLPTLRGNCLFWLDAHYPGADAGLSAYDATQNETQRLPLEDELGVIAEIRGAGKDVIIADDLRVYEQGSFENGPAPSDTLPRNAMGSRLPVDRFAARYHIHRDYRDEGYLVFFPKKNRSWISRFFGR